MTDILPVLLCGGSGTRLWPLSREAFPKQFLPLAGEHTLLQATALRAMRVRGALAPLVVCNADHRYVVAEQLNEIGITQPRLLLEPCARNTAPAIAAAAFAAMADGADPLLLVLPSDHLIKDESGFRSAVETALAHAPDNALVTFGIVPERPDTGFGYIRAGAGDGALRHVDQFVEKPGIERAREYVASGNYSWNSGMFLFRASTFLAELQANEPEMFARCREAVERATRDGDALRLDKPAFGAARADSIDYAVMERTKNAYVLPLSIGWNDVGSWNAVWETMDKDAHGNAAHGDVITIDSRNTYARSERLVALIGVEDLVVIETDDALLVAHRDHVQQVKDVVGRLRESGRKEGAIHRKVARPWGSYDSIDQSDRFQVKRITVKPGAALSLQLHHHRAEHWIVVSGTAKVTIEDRQFFLAENQSTYIPLGSKHRLENPGKLPLEMIEVQSGTYLGEDDIVRFEDVYGRTTTTTP